jgi:hypothetical protein
VEPVALAEPGVGGARLQFMRLENALPLLWDDGFVGSVGYSDGALRVRRAIDREMELDLELARDAAALPTLGLPLRHRSPAATVAEEILDELAQHEFKN